MARKHLPCPFAGLFVGATSLLIWQNCAPQFQLHDPSINEQLNEVFSVQQLHAIPHFNLQTSTGSLPFEGNGSNTSWDGRLLITTEPEKWMIRVLQPKKFKQTKSFSDLFSSPSPFLENVGIMEAGQAVAASRDSTGKTSHLCQLNALALAPASGDPASSNPYPCNERGERLQESNLFCYDSFVYTQHYHDPNWKPQGLSCNRTISSIGQAAGDRVLGRMLF